MQSSLRSYFVDRALPVCGVQLSEIPFPDGAAVTMIVRGSELLVAEGSTELQAGDHVYVLASAEAEPDGSTSLWKSRNSGVKKQKAHPIGCAFCFNSLALDY